MSDMSDAISEFLIESHENLDRLDNDLLTLEERPDDREILASIFRTIHTIKGTCGFLGYSSLESVTHVGENLLGKLRDGALSLDEAITEGLLHMVDAVRQMLAQVEASGTDGGGDWSDLIAELTRLLDVSAAAAPAPAPAPAAAAPELEPAVEVAPTPAPVAQAAEEHVHEGEKAAHGRSVADSKIRVDVEQLDKLMTLVGELVLARNQILQFQPTTEDAGFTATTQRLNLITTELQEGVMKTRMQPIETVWSKLPRVVRDLAKQCGKKMQLVMEGKETDLDKTILEAIKDPLTHIVRNSVDHGVEPPEARAALGKPEEGTLLLRAFHEGGQVNIEIIDDGGGIDVERVKAKALERRIITPDHAARMSDHEAMNLIFAPGFSTAAKVTNVSGRGVGMDVVRTNIEQIGGSVDIQSALHEGTTLRIKIPLTLAIIPALVVTTAGERFAIPQVSLLELVRLDSDSGESRIEYIHGTPVYRLRGNLLPLVYLDEQLGLAKLGGDHVSDTATNIVVLQADGRQFGLVVSDINDTEEIVVKPLDKQLKEVSVYAGATIMGDGRVALILDVLGIAQRAAVLSKTGSEGRGLGDDDANTGAGGSQLQTLLLFQAGANRRMAVQLSTVARLEEFSPDRIEYASGKPVTQYRGEIMPLVFLSEYFGGVASEREVMEVVVYQHDGCSVGLVVDHILDIVEENLGSMRRSEYPGVLGSTVVDGKITDLLDAPGVIATVLPEFFQQGVCA
ncbi:MAG: chemotaxis protein CheA [Planctomycetes bacterium]|nr:chemotaxis protein CheA [Planctomycetota bacterium]